MENRASEVGFGSKSLISKDRGALVIGNLLGSKPFLPSPSPKPSTCWPGAMVQDQRGFVTPQSQRGRFGLHNFPRTPYSRTFYSKSKSQVCGIKYVESSFLMPMVLFWTCFITCEMTLFSSTHLSVASVTR